MPATRYATVHYRKLASEEELPMPLAEAIASALMVPEDGIQYGESWSQRVETMQTDPPQSRFINNVHSDGPTIFGTMCAYTSTQMQALIRTSAQTRDVDISDAPAPQGNDYLHGIAYWLIIGNHCYVVQHPRVTSKALEEYLTWLLHKTSFIQTTQDIILRSDFDLASVGGDPDDIVGLQIGGLVPETVVGDDRMTTSEVEVRRSLSEMKATFSAAKEVIASMVGELRAAKIIDDVPSGAALDVTVDIGYRSKRRKIDRSMLQDIGMQLRNLSDGEVKVRGRNGSTHGDDARLHMKMPFKLVRENSSLLDLDHCRSQLRKVHDRFAEDGKIKDGE